MTLSSIQSLGYGLHNPAFQARYGWFFSYPAPIQSGTEKPEMIILTQVQGFCSTSDTYVIISTHAYIFTLLYPLKFLKSLSKHEGP